MLNNKSVYLPALTGSVIDKKERFHKNEKSFRFYVEDNSLFYYPNLLISAGIHAPRKIKEQVGYTFNDGIILGDSGGYQLASGTLKYSEQLLEKFLYWLEENTNYALNVDFPPGIGQSLEIFKKNLDISAYNYEFFAQHKLGQTKLLNVLHGSSIKRLDLWYSKIKDFNFEGGWSIGSIRNQNIYYILLNFFYLFEKGEIEKLSDMNALIHFLGFSRLKELPLILYLQTKLNILQKNITISFDSSSPFLAATFGTIYSSAAVSGFGTYSVSSSIIKESKSINLKAPLPCSCPVCASLTFGDLLECFSNENIQSSIFYLYVGLHNFYKLLEYKIQIESILSTNSKEIYKGFFPNDIFSLLLIIDEAFNQDKPAEFIESKKRIFGKLLKDEGIVAKTMF